MAGHVVVLLLSVGACGRTEVVVPAGGVDAGVVNPRPDAGGDAGRPDAGVKPVDAGVEPVDAGFDGGAIEPGPWLPKPCVGGRRTLERAVPVVMLVVDSSGSMAEPFDPGVKSQSVRGALRTVLPTFDPFMLLGLTTFPATGDCGVVELPNVSIPRRGQLDALSMWLGGNGGNSPLADAVDLSVRVLAPLRAANSTRQLVLITDGFPNCNPSLNAVSCRCEKVNCLPTDCFDDVRSIARVRAAATSGVATWVLSVDTPDAGTRDLLDGLAEAGLRARTRPDGRRHFHARNGNDIGLHLQTIGARIRACSLFSRSAGRAAVFIDGREIPQDSPDGWSWVDFDNGELAILGASCDTLVASASVKVEIEVKCGP